MKRLLLAALLLAAGPAVAQEAMPVATCGTLPLAYKPGLLSHPTVDLNGNLCISGNITATATTVVAAQSTLPTLGAGNQTPTASLAGAAYVQPIFGSATGGGTQVDLTHGLPVNIVAGAGSGGTASNFGAAFPSAGTAAGFIGPGGLMQGAGVDASSNLFTTLQTALPAGANAIGSVSVSNFPATQPVSGTVTANQGGAPWSVVGNATPGDAFANPTNGVPAWALLGGWDATNTVWRRLQVLAGSGSLNVNLAASNATVTVSGTVTTSPPSNASTNVAQFGGTNVVTGTGASGAGIPRVTVSNDSTVILGAGAATIGALAANQSVNLAQVAGVSAVTGGVNGSQGVGGLAASGASVAGNPVLSGCRAQNAEQTAVTNGQAVDTACDLVGRQIVTPYANKENFLSGTASQTSTTQTSLIAAQGVGVKIYVTAVQCFNSGSTTSTITLTDTKSWEGVNPAGGGFSVPFPVPLVVAANTALQFTPGSASTTQFCNAQGYAGS